MGLLPCILRSLTAFLLSGKDEEEKNEESTNANRLSSNDSTMVVDDSEEISVDIDEKYEDTLLWTESILWLTMV